VVVVLVLDIMVVVMEALETAGLVVEAVGVLALEDLVNLVLMQVELLEEMVDQDQRVVE
tara:strand:- start:441 stop:617 length:177 start_codon:yes stop_codon:yes gene_type:complete